MWRAWIGFNFSHSLGVLLVAGLAFWAGSRFNTLPVGVIIPVLTLIGCVYWFRVPAIGVAIWHKLLRRRMDSVAEGVNSSQSFTIVGGLVLSLQPECRPDFAR